MKKILAGSMVLVACQLGLLAQQSLVSGIFGYYKLSLPGNSDTIVSVPFAQLPNTTVLADSVAGNVITISSPTNLIAGQFVYVAGVQSNTYYARFDSGALEGRQYDITNNGTLSLSLNLKGDSLSGLATGDKVSIVPYWTLGTVFANGNGIHLATTNNLSSPPTQVLLPNLSGTGKNLSATATYYYLTNATDGSVAWRLVGAGFANKNDDTIPLNTYVTIRQNTNVGTTFISMGDVVLTKIAAPLRVNASVQQDNAVGLVRPIQVSLNDSGLMASGAFVPTVNPALPKDNLLIFDNTATNKNKSAAATYYYYNSGWRKNGASLAVDYGTSNVLLPGQGFIIRKATNATAPVWINSATYTNN